VKGILPGDCGHGGVPRLEYSAGSGEKKGGCFKATRITEEIYRSRVDYVRENKSRASASSMAARGGNESHLRSQQKGGGVSK